MNKLLLLCLVSIIIGACSQSKLNLELDDSIKNLINIYIAEYQLEYENISLDSIDLFVYEHPFTKYIMIVESSPSLPDIPFFITYVDKVKIRVFSGTRLLFKDKSQFYLEENFTEYEMKSKEDKNEAVIFDPPFHFYLANNGQFIRCDIWSCLHENLPPIPKPTIKYEPPN